jgi:predicted nucleic acid-binding protein
MIYDTDILIECCRNNAKAKKLIKGDKRRSISAITWLEVIRGAKKRSLHDTKEFLDTFNVIPVSYKIGVKAMALMEKSVLQPLWRRKYGSAPRISGITRM